MLLPQKFFIPNNAFLQTMQHYKKYKIYDVGAGMGHVTRLLYNAKFNVVGIDVFFRKGQDTLVRIIDFDMFDIYEKNSIAMFCRPCHGDFLENSLKSAFTMGCFGALYVGLERNFDKDLGNLDVLIPHYNISINRIKENVGEEKENIWQIKF